MDLQVDVREQRLVVGHVTDDAEVLAHWCQNDGLRTHANELASRVVDHDDALLLLLLGDRDEIHAADGALAGGRLLDRRMHRARVVVDFSGHRGRRRGARHGVGLARRAAYRRHARRSNRQREALRNSTRGRVDVDLERPAAVHRQIEMGTVPSVLFMVDSRASLHLRHRSHRGHVVGDLDDRVVDGLAADVLDLDDERVVLGPRRIGIERRRQREARSVNRHARTRRARHALPGKPGDELPMED